MQQTAWIKTWDYILDLIYPKECVGCNKEGVWLCRRCSNKIIKIKTPYCPKCRRITKNGQFCRNCRRKMSLTGIIISAHYQEPLRETIHRYKYEGLRDLKNQLSNLIIERLKNNLPRGEKIIIPIPLNRKRELERGFNQARELAEIISLRFDIPLAKDVLIRKKYTLPQINLKLKERSENIKDAFRLSSNKGTKGKTILLIDDVTTSGATLNEAAR
ncbi:MAG: ComF family protein, partial [Candidatus Berkelbacteria bacterium]|nr:ComF family protein [Candidatus Berkelbacteria bacterium]